MHLKAAANGKHIFRVIYVALFNGGISIFFFAGFLLLFSCDHKPTPRENAVINRIDSLNNAFGEDLTYDSLKLFTISKLIARCNSIGYPKGAVDLLITASRIYMANYRYEKALEMLNKAKDATEENGEENLNAKVNFYFGKLNFRINNSDIALEYYLKAADLFLRAGDSVFYSKALTDIGNLHLEKGPLNRARDYFKEAIEIDQQTGNLENLIVNYHQMSVYYHRKNDMDSAKIYLDRVFQLSKESKNQLLFAYYLANRASIKINNDNLDEGEEISFDALHLLDSTSPGISPGQTRSIIYANLGILYEKRQNFDESIKYFNLALKDSLYNIVPELRIEFVYRLYKIYRQLGDHQLAYQTLDRYIKLRNMNDRAVADQNLLAMELKYNYRQLQQEHEHKQRRMRLTLIASAFISGLGLLILMLFIQKQRIKIRNSKLQKKLQDIKLERLNRELASQALNMVRINERKISLINTLRQRLPNFKRENQLIVSGIIDDFEKDRNELAWKEFETRFTEVHSEFYKKLSNINPNLTVNERRLCAFLFLNMTTKEISSITGQSIRAIEQARIRLRKQLNLTNSSVPLNVFLNSI